MQILWGSDYVQFYNDAYIPIAGNKHPAGIGQRGAECWQEVWDFSGPLLDRVMATGEATWSEDQPLVLNRNGRPEEGYFTFSYTPIWNEFGQVGGIFIAVNETTQRILGERRERALRTEAQAARENLENVLSSISDEFMMFDANWRFTYINDRAFTALFTVLQKSRQELLGQCIWDVFPEAVDTPFHNKLQQAVDAQTATSFEYYYAGADRWLENRVYPFGDGVSLLRVDITARKKLEQALQVSQTQINSLLNTAPASIAQCRFFANRTYTVDYRSIGCEALTGYTPDEITPDLWKSCILPEDLAAISDQVFDAVLRQEPLTVEYRFRHKDGSLRWIADSLTSRRDEEQDCWIATMVGIDITARKHAEAALRQSEAALRESEERFQLALQGADCGTWDYNLSDQTLIWSDRCKAMFGIDLEAEMSFAVFSQAIHPDDRERIQQAIVAAIDRQQDYDVEMRTLWSNGTVRWVRSIGRVYYNEQGLPNRMAGVALDISHLKQTEIALRESEERYRVLAEAMPQMVWLADRTGVQYWNQRWYDYTGIQRDEALGIGGVQIVHPDEQERTLELWQQAIETGQGFDIEQRIRRHDGVYRWFLNRGLPVQDSSGQITRWVGTITDIDDQKQLETERARLLKQEQAAREAAENANRIKDEFLAVLSHELRSPLNPILGWAKLLRMRKLDATRMECALETIERNAKLQAQLIDDLLDISRILQGKLVLNSTPIALTTIIEEALETVGLMSETKGVQIQTQLDFSPLQISGDSNRLKQVVWNLLSNAVKFTPEGGQVIVSLEYVNDSAQIQVSDTGKGIHPDFLPHVFDRFRQADSTTTRTFGGLGLGLAIAYQIVEMHGGKIQATSLGEGQGATFTVQFPLISGVAESSTPSGDCTPADNLQNIHVLVIEDDTDSRELITTVLQQFGAEVTAVPSATAAMAALSQIKPDILISDIGMPGMDGYRLMQQIRAATRNSEIPAIALSSYTTEADQQKALAVGFQKHLSKPMEPLQLVEAIATLIQNRALLNEQMND